MFIYFHVFYFCSGLTGRQIGGGAYYTQLWLCIYIYPPPANSIFHL